MTAEPETPSAKGQPGLAEAALFGCCPACGERTLFAGIVRFADRCRACGLDYGSFNVGDGPAALLIMIVGAIVVGGAITLHLGWHVPLWVHVLLWVPLTIALVLVLLRMAKGMLLITEHRRQAHEGQLSRD